MNNLSLKTVCFCGSAAEAVSLEFKKTSEEIGNYLAINGYKLLTGGSDRGLLKSVCQGFLNQADSTRVQLVIPEMFRKYTDIQLDQIEKEKIIWVDNTKDQLEYFLNNSDVFLIMPGGFGTLLELFYFLTYKRLSNLNGKIILFNSNRIYDHLMAQIEVLVTEQTLTTENKNLLKIINSIEQLDLAINEV